jgi:PAS domain S-box-containing protein
LFEKAPYAIILVDGETGELLEFNDTVHKELGYTREEFKKMRIHDFEVFESEDEVRKHINKIMEQGYDIFETKHRRKDGEIRDMLVNCHAIALGKRNISLSILIDITEQKNAENKIKSSLREKDVLLKEIHHRVKNNMQVISSLLNLQARQISDKKYVELFNESRNRIASMALVHEKLYNSKDIANVDFKDYIHSLANGLFTFYGISSKKVLLNMSIEDISLSIDTAIPCGLIINELVSNSLKYAFPEEKKGELKIVLNKAGADDNDSVYNLIISDNGAGIPKGIDIRKTKTLGLQLVTNLVEHQLQGSLQLDRSGGTTFSIRFSELKYKSRV